MSVVKGGTHQNWNKQPVDLSAPSQAWLVALPGMKRGLAHPSPPPLPEIKTFSKIAVLQIRIFHVHSSSDFRLTLKLKEGEPNANQVSVVLIGYPISWQTRMPSNQSFKM